MTNKSLTDLKSMQ